VNRDRGRWGQPIVLIVRESAACKGRRAGPAPEIADLGHPGRRDVAGTLRITEPVLAKTPWLAPQCAASRILRHVVDSSRC
jgi:hypothetical protein